MFVIEIELEDGFWEPIHTETSLEAAESAVSSYGLSLSSAGDLGLRIRIVEVDGHSPNCDYPIQERCDYPIQERCDYPIQERTNEYSLAPVTQAPSSDDWDFPIDEFVPPTTSVERSRSLPADITSGPIRLAEPSAEYAQAPLLTPPRDALDMKVLVSGMSVLGGVVVIATILAIVLRPPANERFELEEQRKALSAKEADYGRRMKILEERERGLSAKERLLGESNISESDASERFRESQSGTATGNYSGHVAAIKRRVLSDTLVPSSAIFSAHFEVIRNMRGNLVYVGWYSSEDLLGVRGRDNILAEIDSNGNIVNLSIGDI